MNLAIVFGTRPEVIKVATVYLKAKEKGINVKMIATAQHREMMDMMLNVFDITPDYDMNIMKTNQSLNHVCASVFTKLDDIIVKEQSDWILVQGDTSTAMAGAICAFNREVKVGHIEAGLRSNNLKDPFPEEMNRRVIDQVSDLMFAPTKRAAENLEKEGHSKERIKVTGNTVVDALMYIKEKFDLENIRKKIVREKDYILVTLHRRENWGEKMINILKGIKRFSKETGKKIVFPVHMNPKVRKVVFEELENFKNAILIEPLNYVEFLSILSDASIVASDSGGIQEEAPSFGKFVVVCRNTTERPELIKEGFGILAGTSEEGVYKALIEGSSKKLENKNPFGDGLASERIVSLIE
ncbi:UDP-N-acetylglucosamine 2-epimerase [Thermosipho melanesiensis]|uniref:UDP-N-acetylglucosamine 2-epimerase (non-hydrolyzing) n=2 Tax=Thermosipho melanesiensis TaxID=46541 RepID=A6LL75_THEM4|nr:UDP-N-acetylglucosamine 2-epimerase (non-hydrolyzing) [Thermosipho melanesiensis]ABR30676.1 UDP-N-acetylglucosamine 2-epimerase [Thermosipho melanesiensis BI429]APT73808.1 UDP-N-acetylglucosamine 2-epimerase [Thermosipho melanesiensis]OOC35747.1 UDP-N-acetylglucosamine 2-epimerase [Thermosipho melanesiensis]OOC39046.1 UDP-N-acetylglucosamine 2-epimerase [Thermosipho melanesiensis]OOC39194.1 UDP-N-acetylglucosamine 2-epimerase [Thermosipho melanesiensis]